MYFWYRVLSEGLVAIGVLEFWISVLCLPSNDCTILVSGLLMLVLFGIQNLVNKTRYVTDIRKSLIYD